jgi:hypothetical protein
MEEEELAEEKEVVKEELADIRLEDIIVADIRDKQILYFFLIK